MSREQEGAAVLLLGLNTEVSAPRLFDEFTDAFIERLESNGCEFLMPLI
jgi:hypothetical protein